MLPSGAGHDFDAHILDIAHPDSEYMGEGALFRLEELKNPDAYHSAVGDNADIPDTETCLEPLSVEDQFKWFEALHEGALTVFISGRFRRAGKPPRHFQTRR